ncbi:hypothetical protein HFN_0269 [Helicobacter fennelliae MRY12-0050]|uniref:Uncharacterized protein n=1 Tax=Helicobacter fennelliae MRY12-0050 TaxID=1325130 RepID=T1DVX4_9HELI|nr:hypothetical protein HFN_0269 [Helicobacter fennelliae MRY12-0050]
MTHCDARKVRLIRQAPKTTKFTKNLEFLYTFLCFHRI